VRFTIIVIVALFAISNAGCRRTRGGPRGWTGKYHAVVANGMHTCALDEGDLPHCFGGDDSVTPKMIPLPKVPLSQLSTGRRYACGIGRDDGKIRCWGSCLRDECTPPDGKFEHVDVGDMGGGCAYGSETRCWGDSPEALTPPEDIRREHLVKIVFGMNWGLALTADGAVRVWGTEAVARDPTVIAWTHESAHFKGIGGRGAAACVLDDSGARCVAHYQNQVPPITKGPLIAVDMANPLGAVPACSLTRKNGTTPPSGDIRCTANVKGELIPPLSGTFTSLAVGNLHACGLDTDGKIVCSGNDLYGQVTARNPWP